jgi:hypothetical protein
MKRARAKETTEAKDIETREGMSKQIAEANFLAKQSRELKEKRTKDEKDEKHRLLLQRKEMAKERAKERKEERKRGEEEKKAALALAALEVPTNKGVCWDRSHSWWKVQLCAHRKTWHLGCFGFDDHTKAVAAYSRHTSMTKTELEALDNA